MTKPKPYQIIAKEDQMWITDHVANTYIRLGYWYEKDGRFYATEKGLALTPHEIEKLGNKALAEAIAAKARTPEGLATEPNIKCVDYN